MKATCGVQEQKTNKDEKQKNGNAGSKQERGNL
jgi:hypothetical protein